MFYFLFHVKICLNKDDKPNYFGEYMEISFRKNCSIIFKKEIM